MVRRPLPDSEEGRARKRGKRVSRAFWIGLAVLALVLAVSLLMGWI